MTSVKQHHNVFSDIHSAPARDVVPQLAPFMGPVHTPKSDPKSNISRETSYLPDHWSGKSEYLGGTIIQGVTESRRIISQYILPLHGKDNLEFNYDVFIADEHLLDLAPPGMPPRYVTYRERKESGRVYRHSLGIMIDHEFHSTPEGQRVLLLNIAQVVHAFLLMVQELQLRELLQCKNPYRGFLRKYMIKKANPGDVIRQRLRQWGTLNKPGKANFAKLYEMVTGAMRLERRTLQYCLGIPGLQAHLALADINSVEFKSSGDQANANLEYGSERYTKWRNTLIYEVPPMYTNNGDEVQQQVRVRQVGDFALMLDPYGKRNAENYTTAKRSIRYFNFERNDWSDIDLDFAIQNCGRWAETGELHEAHDRLANLPMDKLLDVLRKRTPGGIQNASLDKVDMFLTRRNQADTSSSVLKKTHLVGEMEYAHLNQETLYAFGNTLMAHISRRLSRTNKNTLLETLQEIDQNMQIWALPGTDDASQAWLQLAGQNNNKLPTFTKTKSFWELNATGGGVIRKITGAKLTAKSTVEQIHIANSVYAVKTTAGSDVVTFTPAIYASEKALKDAMTAASMSNVADLVAEDVDCTYLRPYGCSSYLGLKQLSTAGSNVPFRDDVIFATRALQAYNLLATFIASAVEKTGHPLLQVESLPVAFRSLTQEETKRAALFHALFRPSECVGPAFMAKLDDKALALGIKDALGGKDSIQTADTAVVPLSSTASADVISTWATGIGAQDVATLVKDNTFMTWLDGVVKTYMDKPVDQRRVKSVGHGALVFIRGLLTDFHRTAELSSEKVSYREALGILRMLATAAGNNINVTDETLTLMGIRYQKTAATLDAQHDQTHTIAATAAGSVAYQATTLMLSWSFYEQTHQQLEHDARQLALNAPIPGSIFVPPSKNSTSVPAVLSAPFFHGSKDGFEALEARAKPTFADSVLTLGPSPAHNNTPAEDADVDMLGRDAEYRLRLSSGEDVVLGDVFYHRLQDVYSAHRDLVERMGALVLMFTPVKRDAFLALARYNLIVPMQFMLVRPFISFRVATFIWGEGNAGQTMYAKPDMQWQDDAATKMRFGNFTCYLGAAVTDVSKVFLTEDVMVVGYVNGGGIRPILTGDDLAENVEEMDADMFVFALPYTVTRETIPEVFDWTSEWDRQYLAPRLAPGRSVPDGGYNQSNVYYDEYFDRIQAYRTTALMEEEGSFNPGDPIIPANRICAQTTQMVWDDSSAQRMEYLKGCAAYGPDVSKGMRDKLERNSLQVIEEINFSNSEALVY